MKNFKKVIFAKGGDVNPYQEAANLRVRGKDLRMIRIGDIVKPTAGNGIRQWHPKLDDLTGIVIDEMEMEDGFFMFEVLIGSEVFWLDSIELKLVEEKQKTRGE